MSAISHTNAGFNFSAGDRTKPFVGYCYSIDKPVNLNKMESAFEHNKKILIERGRDVRKQLGIELHKSLEDNSPVPLKEVETTFIEEATKSNPNPTTAEGMIFSKNAPMGPAAPTERPRRRRTA